MITPGLNGKHVKLKNGDESVYLVVKEYLDTSPRFKQHACWWCELSNGKKVEATDLIEVQDGN
jgi:hypothetical protein